MSEQQDTAEVDVKSFEPGHVMRREHYERLAREAAQDQQK